MTRCWLGDRAHVRARRETSVRKYAHCPTLNKVISHGACPPRRPETGVGSCCVKNGDVYGLLDGARDASEGAAPGLQGSAAVPAGRMAMGAGGVGAVCPVSAHQI